jgi:hypothetical protein
VPLLLMVQFLLSGCRNKVDLQCRSDGFRMPFGTKVIPVATTSKVVVEVLPVTVRAAAADKLPSDKRATPSTEHNVPCVALL